MREHKNKSGIYKITNKVNGKVYIGKTKNFYKRYYDYLYAIKKQDTRKINEYLLRSFNKYGLNNFEFQVIEFCDLDIMTQRELYWMTHFNSCDRKYGYNLRMDSSTGMIPHADTILKISNRLKAEWGNGVRSGHSEKLKENWCTRDRLAQSELFTKSLTRYVYLVDGVKLYYRDLVENGLSSVLSSFSRKKVDEVIFKGKLIKRVVLDESKT